jgi:hypothetical protein
VVRLARALLAVLDRDGGGWWNAVHPQLESAQLQRLSLPLDPSRKTGYKLCSFTSNLRRYVMAALLTVFTMDVCIIPEVGLCTLNQVDP